MMCKTIRYECLSCPRLKKDVEESTRPENKKDLSVESLPSSWAKFNLKELKELLKNPKKP